MNDPQPSRRTFLKASALAGLGLALDARRGSAAVEAIDWPVDQKPVHQLTTPPLERVRVAVIGLHRGLEHVRCASALDFAQVVAVCDIRDTAIIRTQLGRTILLQLDVVFPRPYSRINALYGTDAVYFDYPPRLSLDDPTLYGLETKDSDDWLSERDMAAMRERFTHPLWKKLKARASGAGHGGMDFVQSWRTLQPLPAVNPAEA